MTKPYSGNRDPRFVRTHRGGTLDETTHQSLARWAAACAERVLPLFEKAHPNDKRPVEAINATRAWAQGNISMMDARRFAVASHAAARDTQDAAAEAAARATGHAAGTAHVADHELGSAFYALKAVAHAYPDDADKVAAERAWQRQALTSDIAELVLDDMKQRAKKFQGTFQD